MRKILKEISEQYTKNDIDAQTLDRFIRLYQNDDFRFFTECIMVIRGFIGNEFLSDRFDKLSPEQKDIEHRVYKEVWEFLEFILDPRKFARVTKKFETYNKQQLDKIKATQKGR